MKFFLIFISLFIFACEKKVEFECKNRDLKIEGAASYNKLACRVFPDNIILNPTPMVTNGDVSEVFKVSPDGTKIVYLADQDIDGVNELYSVNSDGTNVTKLHPNLPVGREVKKYFTISPNSGKVAFLSDHENNDRFDLYIVNLDGSGLTKVNNGVPTVVHTVSEGFSFSNDSVNIVYVSDEAGTAGDRDLFIAPVSSVNSRIILNDTTPVSAASFSVNPRFELSKSGDRVVFTAEDLTNTVGPIISSTTLDGLNTGYRLLSNHPVAANLGVNVDSFTISKNSQTVVYSGSFTSSLRNELYSISITDSSAGANKVVISDIEGNNANGNVEPFLLGGFNISDDSQRVVFIADRNTDNVKELYSVAIPTSLVAPIPVKINPTLVAGGNVESFVISPNSQRIVYLADQVVDGVDELYSSPISAASSVRVHAALSAGQRVAEYDISKNSARIVFSHNREDTSVFQLYSSSLTGSSSVKLHSSVAIGTGVFVPSGSSKKQFSITPDSSKVVFRLGTTPSKLMGVGITSSNAIALNDALDSGDDILQSPLSSPHGENYIILPTSDKVVYRAQMSGVDNLIIGVLP